MSDLAFDEPIPTDGVVVFGLRSYGVSGDGGLLSVEVRDEHDELVEGTLSVVLLDEGASGPPGDQSEHVAAWRPASPLEADATYQLAVTADHPYDTSMLTMDEEATFQAASGPAAQLPAASISGAAPKISETRSGFECCTHDDFCDSCGTCQQCWATSYAYLPTVQADVELAAAAASSRQIYVEIRANGEARELLWNRLSIPRSVSVSFEEDASGPFCLQVATISLINGEELAVVEECFEKSELPSYTEREPFEEPPVLCRTDDTFVDAGTPDAGGGDAGGNRGDAGGGDTDGGDTGSNDAPATDGSSGGCTQSSPARHAAPPVVVLVAILLAVGTLARGYKRRGA